ncbi:serine/threonine-protein phosphatase 6 regulatory ankyrin repeat subunit A-like isoform X2 [Mytilus californianus]|uniref:serine/threonine-protein phosphatase 6 regulatory ankyrin repeat subunit A-like isoform X2 n=1 Tax=Mytilus californianus TaxID=6549 RepID=UPI00224744EE|nr:serine/threonine-protein phosphatase 6 regulatory ankyrin repeat subunit A-like isoform X2 [Mytilus californianus]
MINFSLTSLLMAVGCSKLIHNVTIRCPTSVERRLQNSYWSRIYCSAVNVYHCIRDERDNLVATCNEPVQIPQGNYPIYLHRSDKIHYERCPKHLYQPFPVLSYEISDCEYEKSSCNGIGQIPCGNGNTTDDSTCGCDYKKGYVMNSQTKCCSPSRFEECYCQYHTCDNNLQELDADFKCINKCMDGYERSTQNICEQISDTAKFKPSKDVSTTFEPISLPDNGKGKDLLTMQNDDVIFYVITCSGVGIFLFNVIFIIIYGSIRSTWRPYQLKILTCSGFIFFMCLFFGFCIGFANEQRNLAYAFTIIVLILLSTTCYLINSLSVHEMITDPEVYNEEYDIRSFRLLKAAANGNLDEMRRLRYEDYIDMDVVDINKRSALHLAACEGQNEVLEYIFRHNFCFLEAKDGWDRSAEDDIRWHHAQRQDEKYDTALKILNTNKDKNIHKRKKKQFKERKALELITAAGKGDLRTIKRLNQLGTDMNLADYSGQTALHAAVDNGMVHIVNYLIDTCNVSPFVRWRRDRRPIDVALAHGKEENLGRIKSYMSSILKNGTDRAKYSEQYKTKVVILPPEDVAIVRLLNYASRGDVEQMKGFKASGYRMDVYNYDSQTALHIAVRENQEYVVDFLLGECDQIDLALNKKDRWMMTPWEVAKKSAMKSVYYIFLKNCPELVETENDDIKTCQLLNAAAEENLETLNSLHEQNVDMNQRDYDGRTALHLAVCEQKIKAVKFLINKAKVDMTIPDRYNRLPIDEDTSAEIKDLLERYKNDEKTRNEFSMSATEDTLMHVMKASTMGILNKQTDLRYKYFKMDSCDYFGDTPLHLAAANGKKEDVQYLLFKRRASPFVKNNLSLYPG